MYFDSGAVAPSFVLKAMGLSDTVALGTLRLTVGRFSTEAEVCPPFPAIMRRMSVLLMLRCWLWVGLCVLARCRLTSLPKPLSRQ